MTQKIRWLAALALLLAVGVSSVRAEEEEEVAPPAPRPVTEVLPQPKTVNAAASCIRIMPPAAPTVAWPVQFATPYPCPCPAPVVQAAFVPYCQHYAACPCPAGCPACPCVASPACTCPDPAEFVVSTKMVKAGADGRNDEVVHPRVTVSEGQTAAVELHGVESPTQHSSCRMEMTVTKHGKNVLLWLGVEDACTVNGESGIRTQVTATEEQYPVQLGQVKKLELKRDADGTPRSWVEVTVTEMERGACTAGTCPAAKPCDEHESPMVGLVQGINDLMCCVADTAADLFGTDAWSDSVATPAEYLQTPPPYYPAAPACPMAREVAGQAPPCCSSCVGVACTRSSCGQCPTACTQCAATMPAQPAMHVSIDGSGDRKSVEISTGKKHLKATADRLMMHDDCVMLEGNVQAECCDDSCCEFIKAEKMCVEHKDGGLNIQMDGCTAIRTGK